MSSLALNLPNNYVEIERDEMEYVDGGGRLTLHFDASSIAGLAAGGASTAALTAALAGIDAKIGAAIIFGTGGTGTVVAAAVMTMLGVAIPTIAGAIASGITSAKIHGYSYTFDDHWFTPTCTINI